MPAESKPSLTPSEKHLAEARDRAMRKRADEIVAMEMGEVAAKVVKGPIPIPDEEQRSITLNLADYADRIVVDNVVYMHARTYEVGQRLFDVLKEMQDRGWEHQRQTEGKSENQFRRERMQRVSL